MPTYALRLVVEAGPEPIDGEILDHAEQVVVVEAATRWEARNLALMNASLRALGRPVQVYDADTGARPEPPPPDGFRPARFTVDGLPGTYDGFTRGNTWNGFAVPFFPLAEACRVADDYAAQPAGLDGQTRAEYDEGRDIVRLYDPSSEEWDEYGPAKIDDGTGRGPRALYSIGGHYWTWEEVGAGPVSKLADG